jgi:hypothetical protein
MLDRGEDPLKQTINQAHAQGHRCWIYNRPQAWSSEQPWDHAFRSRFYAEHPEFRCLEADGTAISKLSIAYPGVRRQLNAILAEALERGADGLALAFVRGYPLVRYERPVAERYRELHGRDVSSVPDTDAGLRQVWAEFVTTWMREIRQMLDDAGPSTMSARRKLVVFSGPSTEWNARFGFDVASWAHQGLVDAVIPYPLGNERTSGFVDVAEYARLLEGTGVQLLPSLGSYADHGMTLAQVRQRAHAFYQAGATGLSRWDTDPYLACVGLDDPVVQELWCEHYMGPQSVELHELQGLHLKRFPSIIGL